jgi:hypothetical protein
VAVAVAVAMAVAVGRKKGKGTERKEKRAVPGNQHPVASFPLPVNQNQQASAQLPD